MAFCRSVRCDYGADHSVRFSRKGTCTIFSLPHFAVGAYGGHCDGLAIKPWYQHWVFAPAKPKPHLLRDLGRSARSRRNPVFGSSGGASGGFGSPRSW